MKMKMNQKCLQIKLIIMKKVKLNKNQLVDKVMFKAVILKRKELIMKNLRFFKLNRIKTQLEMVVGLTAKRILNSNK